MEPKTSRGPLWFGIGLVVVIIGIVTWIYFLQPPAGLNFGIQLSTDQPNVYVGAPFTLSVVVTNNSGTAMQTSSIALVLPQDVLSADNPGARVVTLPVGTIATGGVSHQTFNVIVVGSQNTVEDFTARILYNVAGSSAQFENDGTLNVPVGQPAVAVAVSAPGNVFSGQNFPVTVSYNNNTSEAIPDFSIAMQYPPAWAFVNASTSPAIETNGSNSWSLGTLAPNATGTITMNGNLIGPNNASYPIAATLTENVGGQSYTIGNPAANVVLSPSPLSFAVSVNGSSSYVSNTGDSLNYLLTFTNDSSVAFQNIIISAKFTGAMLDFSTLQASGGSFNSVNDTVTWNGAGVPQLLSLAPGQSGSANVYVRTKSAFPIRLPSDKDYSVAVSAKISSPTVPAGTTASSTISVASVTTKLGGAIALATTAYHKDTTAAAAAADNGAGIKNTGPYPPVVNKATEYSIHWLITNYATDAQNVTISAYLQSGTTCTGLTSAPSSTTLACNAANGEVTWTIPFVAATTGITGKPLEVVFQVTNTPAVNQVGQDVTLIGPATLTATDGFTGAAMQSSAQQVTTALPNDTSVATQQRQVTN
jgi:hypothetical protein